MTLTFALFVFVILAYGSRLTGKLDIAAYNLIYFLGSLICHSEATRAEPSAPSIAVE